VKTALLASTWPSATPTLPIQGDMERCTETTSWMTLTFCGGCMAIGFLPCGMSSHASFWLLSLTRPLLLCPSKYVIPGFFASAPSSTSLLHFLRILLVLIQTLTSGTTSETTSTIHAPLQATRRVPNTDSRCHYLTTLRQRRRRLPAHDLRLRPQS
jgi:hypothetical protein